MGFLRSFFREVKYYPSAIVGVLVIVSLLLLSVYAVVKIPYAKAIELWRGTGEIWYHNP